MQHDGLSLQATQSRLCMSAGVGLACMGTLGRPALPSACLQECTNGLICTCLCLNLHKEKAVYASSSDGGTSLPKTDSEQAC